MMKMGGHGDMRKRMFFCTHLFWYAWILQKRSLVPVYIYNDNQDEQQTNSNRHSNTIEQQKLQTQKNKTNKQKQHNKPQAAFGSHVF